MSRTVKTVIAVVLVAVLGIGLYFLITRIDHNSRELDFTEFRDLIEVEEGAERPENAKPPITFPGTRFMAISPRIRIRNMNTGHMVPVFMTDTMRAACWLPGKKITALL